jgi:muscarinic acetylcholine receptor M3
VLVFLLLLLKLSGLSFVCFHFQDRQPHSMHSDDIPTIDGLISLSLLSSPRASRLRSAATTDHSITSLVFCCGGDDADAFNTSWRPMSNNDSSPKTMQRQAAEVLLAKTVAVSLIAAVFASLTVVGNLMVMVSFRVDRRLQTVTNYFLLSLSVADLAIGLFSMPLYTAYLVLNRWPLGPIVCDVWLSVDYTMSNASVANLLLISFDRYMSVTRPLTYRARRTPRRATCVIVVAWTLSVVLWTPWIVAWPHMEGGRTVPDDQCYIQFLRSNRYFTIATAVAAFYLPVAVMIVVYYRIYGATARRRKNLAELQAVCKYSSDTVAPIRVTSSPILPHAGTPSSRYVGRMPSGGKFDGSDPICMSL